MRPRRLSHAFVHEFRRTLLSVPLLVLIGLALLASTLYLSSVATGAAGQVEYTYHVSGIYYYRDGAYHLSIDTFDSYGNPVGGTKISTVVSTEANATTRPKVVGNATGTTGSDGQLNLAVGLKQGNYTGTLYASLPSEHWETSYDLLPLPQGSVHEFLDTFTQVWLGSKFVPSPGLMIFWSGPNGTSPIGDRAYYLYSANVTESTLSLPLSSMTYLGTMNGPATSFGLVLHPPNGNPNMNASGAALLVEVFDPSGALVVSYNSDSGLGPGPNQFFLTNPLGAQTGAAVAGFVATILGIAFPVLAIIGAYSTYGRDRTSGALESVLVQPIGRLSLTFLRYAGVCVALAIACVGTLALIDGLLWELVRAPLAIGIFTELFLGLTVESAAFIGLVFLFAHVFRSSSGLLGTSLVLAMALTAGWDLAIPIVLASFGVPLASPSGAALANELLFLSPGTYLRLIGLLITGSGNGIDLSALGITPFTLAWVGALWVAAPVAVLLLLVRYRD